MSMETPTLALAFQQWRDPCSGRVSHSYFPWTGCTDIYVYIYIYLSLSLYIYISIYNIYFYFILFSLQIFHGLQASQLRLTFVALSYSMFFFTSRRCGYGLKPVPSSNPRGFLGKICRKPKKIIGGSICGFWLKLSLEAMHQTTKKINHCFFPCSHEARLPDVALSIFVPLRSPLAFLSPGHSYSNSAEHHYNWTCRNLEKKYQNISKDHLRIRMLL